jgi:GNAT superfamily N-acetyltransferase
MDLCTITSPEMLERVYQLRAAVWQPVATGAFETGRWVDDHDTHAFHWAVLDDGEPIAAARFCVHDRAAELPDARFYSAIAEALVAPIGSLNRLVVAEPFRRMGLAGRLDDARLRAGAAATCQTIVCCTDNEHRIRALELRGFNVAGPAQHVDARALAQGRRPMVLVFRPSLQVGHE